jgi:hypothetical protein
VRSAAAFLASALRAGGRSLLVATRAVHRAVLPELERQGIATRRDLKTGRLILATYHRSTAAQLDAWRAHMDAARADGVARVSAVGDVSGGALGRLPISEILEYEAEFDRSIAQRFSVTTLCQYDARVLSGLDAAVVLQRHDGHLH